MGTSTNVEFYRRPLPEVCISFSSKEGRNIFREALESGHMECYFGLASQFRTQDEPAYCGLSSLVMVLNALEVDPRRIWKGVWRWYHEEMLSCGLSLEKVKKSGIDMDQFACLAGCNSLDVRMARAMEPHNEDKFREDVKHATRKEDCYLVATYSRKLLGQTGSGHFSPIGGYHPGRDLVLILDTARFKYPPHWVPLSVLYNAMKDVDKDTGLPRGYFELKRSGTSQLVLFGISQFLMAAVDNRESMSGYVKGFIEAWNGWNYDAAGTELNANNVILYACEKLVEYLKILDGNEYLVKSQLARCPNSLTEEHKKAIEELLKSLRNTDVYKTVTQLLRRRNDNPTLTVGDVKNCCYMSVDRNGSIIEVKGHCRQVMFDVTAEDFIVVLLLLWPYGKCDGTNGSLLKQAVELTLDSSSKVLKNEIRMMNQQVESLFSYLAQCHCKNRHF